MPYCRVSVEIQELISRSFFRGLQNPFLAFKLCLLFFLNIILIYASRFIQFLFPFRTLDQILVSIFKFPIRLYALRIYFCLN